MAHLRETRPDRKRRKGEQGFTLIELLVVITIISILAAVVSTSVGGFITNANEKARASQFAAIQTAVDTFVSTHLDASGDLNQATYPFAGGVAATTGAERAYVGITGGLTGEVSIVGWYGPDGRVCATTGAKCTTTPALLSAGKAYVYVDLYSGSTLTKISSYLQTNGGAKSFAVPSTNSKGVRCLFFSGPSGTSFADPGATVTAAGVTDAEVATAKGNVRTNKGALYACRDADPAIT